MWYFPVNGEEEGVRYENNELETRIRLRNCNGRSSLRRITPGHVAVSATTRSQRSKRESESSLRWMMIPSARMCRCTTMVRQMTSRGWSPQCTVPEVGVGTDEVFTRLDQLMMLCSTSSTRLQTLAMNRVSIMDTRKQRLYSTAERKGSDGGEEGGYVNVLAEGKTGPYNYQVVESNKADILVAWLNENDYEQQHQALPLIEHYVAKEMKFVAVKLQPRQGSRGRQLVILWTLWSKTCIPLVLTGVAAEPDMPVKAYVLGEKRSVPTNWLHVTVNQKKLDWFSMENTWWGSGFNSRWTAATKKPC